jgi:SAM-dependent methyltransferase
MFEQAVERAIERYRKLGGSLAWRFSRGKLRGDPVYRAVLEGPWLARGGGVLDVGCGQGLMLALVAEERLAKGRGEGGRLVGIELRPGVAAIARRALGGQAEIIAADVRTEVLPAAGTILVFDVLHMMPAVDQEAILRGLVASLEPGGTLLLRDADAGAGWRFQAVNLANRMKAFALGYSSKGFYFRTKEDWRALLESHGLSVEIFPMGKGTPYGNVLLAAVKPAAGNWCTSS